MRFYLSTNLASVRLPAVLRVLLGLLGVFFALSCYESDPIQSIFISPDGQRLATITAGGQLGILELRPDEPLRVYSRHAGRGAAWSPDSRRLVFVEQQPNHHPELWLIDVESGLGNEPLVSDPSWKADPVWFGANQLAWLGDGGGETIDIWSLDLATSGTMRRITAATDILHLWGASGAGQLLFETESASGAYLWWWAGEGQPTPVLPHLVGDARRIQALALGRDGRRMACAIRHGAASELLCVDLESGTIDARLALESPAHSVALLDDGSILASDGARLLTWRPEASWPRRTVVTQTFHKVPLGPFALLGGRSAVVTVNGNLLLKADNVFRLESGRIRFQRIEEMLQLAWSYTAGGQADRARRLLDALWEGAPKGSRHRYLIAAVRARIDRGEKRWRKADRWLGRTLEAAPRESHEETAAWLERLAGAGFDARDLPLTRWILGGGPQSAADRPLVVWLTALLEAGDEQLLKQWLAIGGDVRAERYREAAHEVRRVLERDPSTTCSLVGMSLLAGGDLEPLGRVDGLGERHLNALMGQHEFQLAALAASRARALEREFPPEEWRALLLSQWIREGNFEAARSLALEDMAQDGPQAFDYADMLENYLAVEEVDPWFEDAFTDVLLTPEVLPTLEERIGPARWLPLQLAMAKSALVEGDLDRVQAALDRIRPRLGDPDGVPLRFKSFMGAQHRVLFRIFYAKVNERRGRWGDALEAYRAAAELMERTPANWDIAANEVAFAFDLIRTGRHDGDLLQSYLSLMRGLGDALINPAHDKRTIQAALHNLDTLGLVAPDPWIQPYLFYSRGVCHAQLGQHERALYFLRRARNLFGPMGLTQRILLEEAAQRDSLGQHALAGRLYDRLIALPNLATPVRAAALMSSIHSKTAAGEIDWQAERLAEGLVEADLPGPWRRWMWMQIGSEE